MSEEYVGVEDILNVDDVQYDVIEVPEWRKNGQPARVRIGSLSAGDVLDFIESNEGPAKRTAGLRLIIKSLVDKEGKRIGNDKLIEGLKGRNQMVIKRLVERILKHNGIESEKAAQAAATLVKNE